MRVFPRSHPFTPTLPRAARVQRCLLAASLILVPVWSGCHGGGDSQSAGRTQGAASAAPAAAVTDSTTTGNAAADTSLTDSTRTKGPDAGKPGFLAKLFHRPKKDEKKTEDEAVPVELATVRRDDLPAYLAFTATLEPEKQADVLAKISGEIREIKIEEGAFVRQGDVLALLDGASQRVVLEEMEARARALKLDLERGQRLHDQNLGSDKEVSDAEARFAEAEALRKGAELNVAYTRITAPFGGRISTRHVDPGQNVNVGTVLFTIVDPDPLLASIHLPEKDVARLSVGQRVRVSPDTNPSLAFDGSVLRIAPVVDARTGTVKVTCRVHGETSELRPGSFVRVKLQTEVRHGVLVVPKRALVPEGADNYLFKAVGDSVAKVSVLTGITDSESVEIVSGIDEADRVVTVGQGALKPGSKVREAARRIGAKDWDAASEPADTVAARKNEEDAAGSAP